MASVSTAASAIRRSGIREIFDLARTVPGTIHLEVGEPNFPTPGHIVEAAAEAGRSGFTKYTPNAGVAELREALVDKVRGHNGLDVSVEQIVVTNGAVEALFSTFLAILEPGDEVLLADPGWPNFKMMVEALQSVAVPYALGPTNRYAPTAQQLEALVTDKTKAIVINSPSNPLGTIIDPNQLHDIASVARERDLWLISDECYEAITFDDSFRSAAQLDPERIVSVFSFSKTYSMTGWRVGYVVGAAALMALITKLQEPIISCVNAPAQRAALAALTGPQDAVEEMRKEYLRRRDATLALFDREGVPALVPRGAFYIWVDISASGVSSREFSLDLIKEQGVAVAPGTAFGDEGDDAVRISLATAEDELLEGATRIAKALENG